MSYSSWQHTQPKNKESLKEDLEENKAFSNVFQGTLFEVIFLGHCLK